MEVLKIGSREFREQFATYLESKVPVAIQRHGQTIGYYIPTPPKRNNEAEVKALREATEQLDALVANWGVSEDELAAEFDALRKAGRKRGR